MGLRFAEGFDAVRDDFHSGHGRAAAGKGPQHEEGRETFDNGSPIGTGLRRHRLGVPHQDLQASHADHAQQNQNGQMGRDGEHHPGFTDAA